jgi:hypothetical protein
MSTVMDFWDSIKGGEFFIEGRLFQGVKNWEPNSCCSSENIAGVHNMPLRRVMENWEPNSCCSSENIAGVNNMP